MLSAVILAAGDSRRMGLPKALLEWRGRSFLEAVCDALRAAGVEERIAVLGRASEEILAGWKPEGERIAVNPRPGDGQLSSLRTGLEAAARDAEAFMVCLVDQPAILPETYKKIIACWESNKSSIIIPRAVRPSDARLKRGHPIIIPALYKGLCFEGPLESGLHWVTHHPSAKVLDLDVNDENVIRDVDTPEDYRKLKES